MLDDGADLEKLIKDSSIFSHREFMDLIEERLVIRDSRSLSMDSRTFEVSEIGDETNGVYVILTRGFDIVGFIYGMMKKIVWGLEGRFWDRVRRDDLVSNVSLIAKLLSFISFHFT